VVYANTRAAIAYGVHPVIGTTGLSPAQLDDLQSFSDKASIGGAVIPNFSVGMVLLQQAAAAAARFYDHAELTELHHNRKADAPSGTCIKTAELMEELGKQFNESEVDEHESLAGSRGGQRPSGLRLHSLRLPGLVAHQEVILALLVRPTPCGTTRLIGLPICLAYCFAFVRFERYRRLSTASSVFFKGLARC
jgi:4-hydroxy-tetrahydrodipicolinate reductase